MGPQPANRNASTVIACSTGQQKVFKSTTLINFNRLCHKQRPSTNPAVLAQLHYLLS
jgi:hypothetical protein